MVTTVSAQVSIQSDRPISQSALVEAAALFILEGDSALPEEVLSAARAEIARRIARAKEFSLPPREVVKALLKPLFSPLGHCRCSSCLDRCVICHYSRMLAHRDT